MRVFRLSKTALRSGSFVCVYTGHFTSVIFRHTPSLCPDLSLKLVSTQHSHIILLNDKATLYRLEIALEMTNCSFKTFAYGIRQHPRICLRTILIYWDEFFFFSFCFVFGCNRTAALKVKCLILFSCSNLIWSEYSLNIIHLISNHTLRTLLAKSFYLKKKKKKFRMYSWALKLVLKTKQIIGMQKKYIYK